MFRIIRRSFQKVRKDVTGLKENLSEWIMFYNKKHKEHDRKLEILEQRIVFLEKRELEKRW